MIFGVAVVFPVVITFGVAGVLAERHAQAPVQGFSRGHQGKANSYRRCAPVNNVLGRERCYEGRERC